MPSHAARLAILNWFIAIAFVYALAVFQLQTCVDSIVCRLRVDEDMQRCGASEYSRRSVIESPFVSFLQHFCPLYLHFGATVRLPCRFNPIHLCKGTCTYLCVPCALRHLIACRTPRRRLDQPKDKTLTNCHLTYLSPSSQSQIIICLLDRSIRLIMLCFSTRLSYL